VSQRYKRSESEGKVFQAGFRISTVSTNSLLDMRHGILTLLIVSRQARQFLTKPTQTSRKVQVQVQVQVSNYPTKPMGILTFRMCVE
jgi:hypothetical protein